MQLFINFADIVVPTLPPESLAMGRHKGEHPPTRDEYEDCADDLHDVREVGVPARRDEKRWVIFSVESVLTIPTRGIETNYWLFINNTSRASSNPFSFSCSLEFGSC